MRYLIFTLLIIFSGCTGTEKTISTESKPYEIEAINDVDLSDYLRKKAGVQVQGSGANARILIRGINSMNAGTEPLFVVDGVRISGGYSSVYNLVNIQNIARVRVLKNASETAFYGLQGSNGVIEITTKRE